jgi:hypothetical protein
MADNISGAENTRCMVGRGWAMGREGIGLRHHFVRGNITSPRFFFVFFDQDRAEDPAGLRCKQSTYYMRTRERVCEVGMRVVTWGVCTQG